MAYLVSDILLVSMVEDTDGPIVWSDAPRSKYDPEKLDLALSTIKNKVLIKQSWDKISL